MNIAYMEFEYNEAKKKLEKKFRTIKGYKQIPFLINALNKNKAAELAAVV